MGLDYKQTLHFQRRELFQKSSRCIPHLQTCLAGAASLPLHGNQQSVTIVNHIQTQWINSHQPIENILSCVGLTSAKETAQKMTVPRVCIHTHTMTLRDGIYGHRQRNHTMKSHPGMEAEKKGKGHRRWERIGKKGKWGKGKDRRWGGGWKEKHKKGKRKARRKEKQYENLPHTLCHEKAYYLITTGMILLSHIIN